MPYKRREPVSEEELLRPVSRGQMEYTKNTGYPTICQALREIYQTTDNADIKLKCRLAMAYAKAMDKKLKHYKDTYEPDRPAGITQPCQS